MNDDHNFGFLKDFDPCPFNVEKVIIDCEQTKEGEVEGDGRQKMPHIMIIKEISKAARIKKFQSLKNPNFTLPAKLVPLS